MKNFMNIAVVSLFIVYLILTGNIWYVDKEKNEWKEKKTIEINPMTLIRMEKGIQVTTVDGVQLEIPWHRIESIQSWDKEK